MAGREPATQRSRVTVAGVLLLVASAGCATESPSASATPGTSSSGPTPFATTHANPTWTTTGEPLQPRNSETATLLLDGRVLVAGGAFGEALTSAELYDPTTGAWTATGAMTQPHVGHTATLLADGRVLVAGGLSEIIDPAAVASAELYDPVIGTWATTAPMTEARDGHTAVLLLDGTVLVMGGQNRNGVLASTERYNPIGETWTPAGTLTGGRVGHTATRLPDGSVLVAGGLDSFGAPDTWATIEVYEPVAGSWTVTGDMVSGRSLPTATLLEDGQVLVAGGSGMIPDSVYASAELYDPLTGAWTATGAMAEGHQGHSATLLDDGMVLVIGGGSPSGSLSSAELYDPASRFWAPAAPMLAGRGGHLAVGLLDGRVLVFGGCCTDEGGDLPGAELYDPGS